MKKNKKDIKILLQKPTTLYEQFHDKTKLIHFPQEDATTWPEEWKTVAFKGYGRAPAVVLPKPKRLGISLEQSFYKRKSVRAYNGSRSLSTVHLSTLLYYSFGIREQSAHMKHNRFYPSGGSRYPLETYIISLNSALEKSLYHYYVKGHLLEKLVDIDKKEVLHMFHQDFLKNAACIILMTAVFKRTTMKYGDRGYRHILAEAGHAAQNMYLTSAALAVGCCAIGGYKEKELETLIDMNGVDESVVYAMAVGNLK